jgi:3-hydroxybutyryl-CoA dehydrogenase
MKIVVIADEALQQQFVPVQTDGHEITWQATVPGAGEADCCIDLLYEPHSERQQLLEQTAAPLIIVNDVAGEPASPGWVRINGWPSLIKGALMEASGPGNVQEQTAMVLSLFGKQVVWLPPGSSFVTPRVISMIINEAYLALEEEVSTRKEINTAMKLGTNYPYGPFEWAEQIGLARIVRLLQALAASQPRYTPAPLLLKDAGLQ